MDSIEHRIRAWNVKYGQVWFERRNYAPAIKMFSKYIESRSFDIETPDGVFRNKRFIHYEKRKVLRLACGPFFSKLKEGDVIYMYPLRDDTIKISKEPPELLGVPLSLSKHAESIVSCLKQTQFKSSSPMEFEEAIKDATSFLGFESELIGGSGDTDVLLSANIGQESFKANADGKTSKSGKITDRQIDWISLRDHKEKNKADFVIVVGPGFSGGNLLERASEYGVSLLVTEDLVRLVEAHSRFPFTLVELRDLFAGEGNIGPQVDDLLAQNLSRRNLLEQFHIIIEEMQALQDRLGYFTFDSLAGREKLEELDIEPEDIDYIITLLKLPFINGIKEVSENRHILTIKIKDIANIFQQISDFLVKTAKKEESPHTLVEDIPKPKLERKLSSKYFEWEIRGHSIVALARQDKPYENYCPIDHFLTILEEVINTFEDQNVVNTSMIFAALEGQELAPDRSFRGKGEEYKIRMELAILEIEGLIKWTGSKRPIEYILNVPIEKLGIWSKQHINVSEG